MNFCRDGSYRSIHTRALVSHPRSRGIGNGADQIIAARARQILIVAIPDFGEVERFLREEVVKNFLLALKTAKGRKDSDGSDQWERQRKNLRDKHRPIPGQPDSGDGLRQQVFLENLSLKKMSQEDGSSRRQCRLGWRYE